MAYLTNWAKRVKVTVLASVVDEAVPFAIAYLSDLPSGWHTAMSNSGDTDGRTIRVTTSDGVTECAVYVPPGSIDTGSDTGVIFFKATGMSASVDTDYYIYVGNATANAYATTDTYGRNAVFSDYAAAYLPGITTNGLTGSYNLTATGSPGTTASGFEGITAATYNGSSQYHGFQGTTPITTWPMTLEGLAYTTDITSNQTIVGMFSSATNNDYGYLYFNGLSTDGLAADFKGSSGSTASAATATDYTTSAWHYVSGSRDANTGAAKAYLNGASVATDSTSISTASFNRIAIGTTWINAGSFSLLTGRVAFAAISSSVRSANYMTTQNQNWLGNLYSVGSFEEDPTTTGWIPLGTASQTSTSDVDISNINNAKSYNSDAATVTLDDTSNLYSETLSLTAPVYGMTIPSGMTYTVKFKVTNSAQTNSGKRIYDKVVKFKDGSGSQVGSNLASATFWPASATERDYTVSGYSPVVGDFTSSAGIAIQIDGSLTNGSTTANIQSVFMKVDFAASDATASGAGVIGAFMGSGTAPVAGNASGGGVIGDFVGSGTAPIAGNASGGGVIGDFVGTGEASAPHTASGGGEIGAFEGTGNAETPSTAFGGGVIGDFIGTGTAPVESLDSTASGGGEIGAFIGAGGSYISDTANGGGEIGAFIGSGTCVTDVTDSTASGAGVIGAFIGGGISITDVPQPISSDALAWYLSGAGEDGESQRDQALSLGGYRSGMALRSMTWNMIDPLLAIEILEVGGGNGRGAGSLTALTEDSLTWTPPNGIPGAAVTLALGDEATLYGFGGNGWIRVRRRSGLPLVGPHTVKCIDLLNNGIGFDNVSSEDAIAGATHYRAVIGRNRLTVPITGIRIWLDAVDSAGLALAYEVAVDGAMQTIANETTAPLGVVWNTGTSSGTGLVIPGLAPGAMFGLWIRRTIAADAAPMPSVLNHIHVEMDDLTQTFTDALRGRYRIAREDYETYGLWLGMDADPDISGEPDALFASKPFTTVLGLAVSHIYHAVVRWRNKWGLWGAASDVARLVMDADGEQGFNPPSAPSFVGLTQTADNQVVVSARYEPAVDAAARAEIFVIWVTADDTAPDPLDVPTGYKTMGRASGIETMKFTDTVELLDGTPVQALVRTLRLVVLDGETFVPDTTQLPVSGAGTIVVAQELTGWDSSGYAKVLSASGLLQEVIEYSSLVVGSGISTFTVDAGGRGLWGTTAAATTMRTAIYPIVGVDSINTEPTTAVIDGMAPARPWGEILFGDLAAQEQEPIAGPDGATKSYIDVGLNFYLLLGVGWCEFWMDTVLVWKVFQDGNDGTANRLCIPSEWDLVTGAVSGAASGVFLVDSATSLYLCAGEVQRMHLDTSAMTITAPEFSTLGELPEVAPQSLTWEQYAGTLLQAWDPARSDYRPYARLSSGGTFTSEWDLDNTLSQAEVLAL